MTPGQGRVVLAMLMVEERANKQISARMGTP